MTSLTIQENTKTTNGNHDAVDGRHNGQEMLEKVQNGKTPNNNHNINMNMNNNVSYSSLPPDMPAPALTSQQAEKDQQAESAESEERRRTAHRVFSKQGGHSRPVGRLPLPTASSSSSTSTTSLKMASYSKSGPSSPNSSGLPAPPLASQERKEQRSISSIQTYRQFKEQQRLSRQTEERPSHVSYRGEQKISDPGPAGSRTSFSSLAQSSKVTGKQCVDIKSVQKEAVMSYLDRMNQGGPPAPAQAPRPGAAGAPPDIAPPPAASSVSPRHGSSYHANLQGSNSNSNSNQKT